MIEMHPLGPVQANCIVLTNQKHALLFDPGAPFMGLDDVLRGKKLVAVVLTHGHFDHIGGLSDIVKRYEVPVYIHEKEVDFLKDRHLNGSDDFGFSVSYEGPVQSFRSGPLTIEDFDLTIYHTPGHTPGSCCIAYEHHLITGDTLFMDSCGRTDLPGGNWKQMEQSLALLAQLPNYQVYPGHGQMTSIDQEKRYNPYLRPFVKETN